jgi:hypothetical protein
LSSLSDKLDMIRKDAAECTLVASLATDPQKKKMYQQIADHLTALADEVAGATKDLDAA